jgi:DUF1680 family protein
MMNHSFSLAAIAALTAAALSCNPSEEASLKKITPVDFSAVKIDDAFWSPRLMSHKETTLPVCIDQIENQTGRIRNFENAAARSGEHSGIYFDDSDVYKALEGMAYSLQNNPDPVLEAKCDEWIDKFAAAQMEDGYINTFYILTGLDKRWTDMDKHEMYCAGHMIEAGVAYYKVTGKRKLLDVCIRMADHMMSVFGPGKRHWVPGHEEIELALVKLYQTTGEKKYLDFAEWLIENRGHGYYEGRAWDPKYNQDDVPVSEMSEIAGHAVRAMYLYCGMADVAAYTGNKGYMEALDRLWDDVVLRNMYITGGIGQTSTNEGFSEDYDLPNLTAYCETCASVGMVLWNWRMNQFTGDSKYADIMEKALFNGALAGISLKGDHFFYVNPLECEGGMQRLAWFGCACCPSQICRFLPSVGNYVYGVSDEAVWINLYMGGTASFKAGGKKVTLSQKTGYPWTGDTEIKVGVKGGLRTQFRIRIPGWCKAYSMEVNGKPAGESVEKGYAVIDRRWKDGDVISLHLEMPAEMVAADPRVKADLGKRAIQRGPLVYCAEEIDNIDGYDSMKLTSDTVLEAIECSILGGITEINAYSGGSKITCIPYYAWDNRYPGKMKVWIDYEEK